MGIRLFRPQAINAINTVEAHISCQIKNQYLTNQETAHVLIKQDA